MSINLKWWNIKSRKKLTERVVADFKAVNPDINIIHVLNSTDDYKRILRGAGQNKSLPDIWFNWGGTLCSFYTENGLSYDLTDFAKVNNWDKKFFKSSLDLSTYNGNLAGFPISINMIGIFYRKDIFNECGLCIPSTFEEFENVMETLRSKGYTPMALCGFKGWNVMFLIEALIEMYVGSEEHDRLYALKSSWNTDSIIKVFAKFREYIDKGFFPDRFKTLRGYESKLLLYSKKAAMSFDGPGIETFIFNDNQDPNLYGYFKLPLSQKGNRMSGFVEMMQFNASLSEDKLVAAMKFIDYIYSPKSIAKYGNLIKQPIPRNDNILHKNLTMIPKMLNDLNKFGRFTITDQALPQEVVSILFKVQNFIIQGIMTPKQAAEYMQKNSEEYLISKLNN